MLCRSGIAPAMCHRLSGLSTYRLNGHRQGDEHPAYAPDGAWHPLPLPYHSTAQFQKQRINLGLVIPRSEDIVRFILGLSFGILAMLPILGITILGITQRCL